MKTLQAIIILLTVVLYGCSNDENPLTSNTSTVLLEKAFVDSTSTARYITIDSIRIPNASAIVLKYTVESNYTSGAQPEVGFSFADTNNFTLFDSFFNYADSLKNKELTFTIDVTNYRNRKLFLGYGCGNLQPGIWVKTYALKIY